MGIARDTDGLYVGCHILCSTSPQIPLHARRLARGVFLGAATVPQSRDSETA